MLTIPFDDVHAALSWWFNRSWVRKQSRLRSPVLVRYQSSPTRDDPETVAKAFLCIAWVLNRLSARNFYILREHYSHRGATKAEVAILYGLAGGDRCVRRILCGLVGVLQAEMIKIGIVRLPKTGEVKYARDEGTNP